MTLQIVRMNEINQIFAVTDRLGIHREAVEIPLSPESPGRVTRAPSGKFRIVVDAEVPLAQWVHTLEAELNTLLDAP
ncbi:MAG: hypothetical protein ACOYXU_04805 [Nitrospirota bacterium]